MHRRRSVKSPSARDHGPTRSRISTGSSANGLGRIDGRTLLRVFEHKQPGCEVRRPAETHHARSRRPSSITRSRARHRRATLHPESGLFLIYGEVGATPNGRRETRTGRAAAYLSRGARRSPVRPARKRGDALRMLNCSSGSRRGSMSNRRHRGGRAAAMTAQSAPPQQRRREGAIVTFISTPPRQGAAPPRDRLSYRRVPRSPSDRARLPAAGREVRQADGLVPLVRHGQPGTHRQGWPDLVMTRRPQSRVRRIEERAREADGRPAGLYRRAPSLRSGGLHFQAEPLGIHREAAEVAMQSTRLRAVPDEQRTQFGALLCRAAHGHPRACPSTLERPRGSWVEDTTPRMTALARRAGHRPAYVHGLEHGTKRNPTRATVERLSSALELDAVTSCLLLIAAGHWPWHDLDEDTAALIARRPLSLCWPATTACWRTHEHSTRNCLTARPASTPRPRSSGASVAVDGPDPGPSRSS